MPFYFEEGEDRIFVDDGTSWLNTMDALIEHGRILSRACGNNKNEFHRALKDYTHPDSHYPQYHKYKDWILTVEHSDKNPSTAIYDTFYVVTFGIGGTTNDHFSKLLESEY